MNAAPARSAELLYFDGCPNYEALLPRLRALLEEVGSGSTLELRRIESEEEAQRLRFLGSPTVRVDGRDVEPDASARQDFGLKCRLYRTAEGIVGAPSDGLIRAALSGKDADESGQPPNPAALLQQSEIFSGRPVRDRLEGCPGSARELHRRVLRSFLSGRAPDASDLRLWSAELAADLDDSLAELQRRDVMWLDSDNGAVTVAYPFSGTATRHEVELSLSGVRAFAMCAIDALGIPFMADQAATVRSRDAKTGEGIEVRVDPAGVQRWVPPGTVVLARLSGRGPSADCCCPHVNFVGNRERAETLLESLSASQEAIFEMPEAIALGRGLFGTLLRDG
jgi:hypothetical protein